MWIPLDDWTGAEVETAAIDQVRRIDDGYSHIGTDRLNHDLDHLGIA